MYKKCWHGHNIKITTCIRLYMELKIIEQQKD